MSIIGSMSTSISGLEANGQALAVISDNIVNANTTGFKASRGEFQSVLGQDFGGGGGEVGEIGRGTSLGGVTGLFTQGSTTRTERATDVAINGSGFFILKNEGRGLTYTRDGSFRFDKDGWLTSINGQKVQAYQATGDGKLTAKLADIRIPSNSIPAKATKKVDIHVNLDARTPISPSLDQMRPDETCNFTASVQVYDSIGNAHPVGVYFTRKSNTEWEWSALTDGSNLQGGKAGIPEALAKGKLTFDQDGKLVDSEQSLENTTFVNGAVANQKLAFDFGKEVEKNGKNAGEMDTTTMFGSKSSLFRNGQDGYAAGSLTDTLIDEDGVISGVYTNGQNRLLGQLALARFDANEKLDKLGQNQYRETVGSGQANVGQPNSNGRGTVMTRSLESSNVDIAKEFVNMIKTQRGFQASAKGITTANEMLDEVINLRRGA